MKISFQKFFIVSVLLILAIPVMYTNALVIVGPDTGNNPVPVISSIGPTFTTAGGPGFNLIVNGTGFTSTSKVRWNGQDRITIFTSATILQATVSMGNIATPGSYTVTVFNPTPGGGTSNSKTFTVNPIVTTGKLTVTKRTLNGDGTFNFSVFPTPTNFNLTTTVANNHADSKTLTLTTGTYSLTEVVPSGWALAVICSGGIHNPIASGVSITIVAGGNMACTFTNTLPPQAYTLSVQSMGVAGVTINSSRIEWSGNTNYSRVIAQGTPVNLTAPPTFGNFYFSNWDQSAPNACNSIINNGRTCNVTLTSNRTVVAIYLQNPPTKITPTITTNLSVGNGATVPVGTSVFDTATLTVNGQPISPGGAMDFYVYAPVTSGNNCATGGEKIGLTKVVSGATVQSDALLFTKIGTYYWKAYYYPAANSAYNPAVSICNLETVTVSNFTPPPKTTTLRLKKVCKDSNGATQTAAQNPDKFVLQLDGSTGNIDPLTTFTPCGYTVNPMTVSAGRHEIKETTYSGPAGGGANMLNYTTAITCDNGVAPFGGNGSTISNVTLTAGTNVTCTITNTYAPSPPSPATITIKKIAKGGTGKETFQYNIYQNLVAKSPDYTRNITAQQPVTGKAGQYQGFADPLELPAGTTFPWIQEKELGDGWKLDSAVCEDAGGANICSGSPDCVTKYKLKPGDNITCTFTNTKSAPPPPPLQTLSVNSSGVAGVPINSSDNNAFAGTTNYQKPNITTGTLVSLSAPATVGTFTFSNWVGCKITSTGTTCNVTMDSSKGVTAVYVGSPTSGKGTLRFIKKTVGSPVGTFSYITGGFSLNQNPLTTAAKTTTTGEASQDITNLTPGSDFSISENQVPAGWSFTSAGCKLQSGAATGTPMGESVVAITVNANQTTTCTFTNTKTPPPPPLSATLKLVKVVDNTGGGSGTASDWTLSALSAGDSKSFKDLGNSTTFHPVTAGVTYNLSESSIANYFIKPAINQLDWYCDQGVPQTNNTVTPPAGKNITCTITNTYVPPTATTGIRIIKKTPGNTIPTKFDYYIFPTPSTLSVTTATNGEGENTLSVSPANYTITEALPTDWKFGSVSCDQPISRVTDNITSVTMGTTVLAGNITTCTFTNTLKATDTKTTPRIQTILSATSVAVGQSVTDAAWLTGVTSGGTPTSTIQYTIYRDTGCTAVAQAWPAQPIANGSVPNSPALTFILPGTYYYQATYSGDSKNNAVTSPCTSEVLTVASTSPPPGQLTIINIDPVKKSECDQPFTMIITGTGYRQDSLVRFGQQTLTPTSVQGSTSMTLYIPSLPGPGDYYLTVVNPYPNGGTSNQVKFTIDPSSGTPPTLERIDPDTTQLNESAFSMTVTGSNFTDKSMVKFENTDRQTTFISSTELIAQIPDSDMKVAGVFNISMFDPGQNGGKCGKGNSSALPFTVSGSNPPPPPPKDPDSEETQTGGRIPSLELRRRESF